MSPHRLIIEARARALDLPHVGPWEGSARVRALLGAIDQALSALDALMDGVDAQTHRETLLHARATLAVVRVAQQSPPSLRRS